MSDTTYLDELIQEIELYFKFQKNYAATNNTSAMQEMKDQKVKVKELIDRIKKERATKTMLKLCGNGK